MGSEVRPPLTVEETRPHFNHRHISDIWNNMSGSGDRVGLEETNAKGELIKKITYVKVDNVNRSYWHYW